MSSLPYCTAREYRHRKLPVTGLLASADATDPDVCFAYRLQWSFEALSRICEHLRLEAAAPGSGRFPRRGHAVGPVRVLMTLQDSTCATPERREDRPVVEARNRPAASIASGPRGTTARGSLDCP